MKSFYARLYLDILDRIKNEVPEIRWTEQDFGQDSYDEYRPAILFPALLIDFPETSYEGLSELDQFARTTISLRLLAAPFTQSYEGAPVEIAEDALGFFEIEQKVVEAIHGWSPDYCQPLIRERAASDIRNKNGLRVRELTFSTAHEECFE